MKYNKKSKFKVKSNTHQATKLKTNESTRQKDLGKVP